MRFTVTGEWTKNHLLAYIVLWFLAFAVLLWLTNLGLYFHSMGLDPAGVRAHYLGDPEAFRPARSLRSLLEVSHFHVFAMAVMLTTLTHLLLFVPISPRKKFWLTTLAFGGAVADEGAGWLVRFGHPSFAPLKIAGFVCLQASYLAIVGLVGWAIMTKARSAYRDTEGGPPGKE